MADLSTEAILLATEGEDDVPAKLTCHYFATSALVKEWTMEMPEKEGILAKEKALTFDCGKQQTFENAKDKK